MCARSPRDHGRDFKIPEPCLLPVEFAVGDDRCEGCRVQNADGISNGGPSFRLALHFAIVGNLYSIDVATVDL